MQLGDPYAVPNRNYANDDNFFFTFGIGFIPVSSDFMDSIISDYYNVSSETFILSSLSIAGYSSFRF